MSKDLPDHPNLDHLRHEARQLSRAHQRGDPEVCAVLRQLGRFRGSSDEEIVRAKVSLQEVQHALANKYGFAGWTALKKEVARRVRIGDQAQKAYEVFAQKGPDRNSTISEYSDQLRQAMHGLLASGDEGFEAALRLAASPNGKARRQGVLYLALSPDPRATERLVPYLSDESVDVRRTALRGYASRIRPDEKADRWWEVSAAAPRVPDGIEPILACLNDPHEKVRLYAVQALTAYAALGDDRIADALEKMLQDPRHKVRHAAAKALQVPCPGCGG